MAASRQAREAPEVIAQATGIVMERCALEEAAAFALLVYVSQGSNVSLQAVAELLVDEWDMRCQRRPA